MKLIVGLGNPGRRYRDTRHNVGFAVVDEVARRGGAVFEAAPAEAVMARTPHLGSGVWLVKPLTMMNLSGVAVADLMRYFRIDVADLLVVADDANLPIGRLRARPGGSDGGHRGFRSIGDELGRTDWARLRVGIGRGDPRRDLADHVLARFDEDERAAVEAAVRRAADAVEVFVREGIDRVMNAFNGPDEPPAGTGTREDGTRQTDSDR